MTDPSRESITRDYRGWKYVAQDLADAETARLEDEGWRVVASEWLEPDDTIGCFGVMIAPWRTEPLAPSRKEYTLRVTYERRLQ